MKQIRQQLEQQAGIWRSLAIYYGVPGRLRHLTHFYRQFIQPGDLCFDIGAHVGNRIGPWTKLGARVVAIEPQAHLMVWLRRLYGSKPDVTLLQAAVGAQPGTATLRRSRANPTVATLSDKWLAAVSQDASFASINWNESEAVRVTTLDMLIAEFGRPALVKIDVEGFEPEVLAGLSIPLPVISFEYIPAAIDLALACVDQLEHLGHYEYNWFTGETHRLARETWLPGSVMHEQLSQLAAAPSSGDIFARLRTRQSA